MTRCCVLTRKYILLKLLFCSIQCHLLMSYIWKNACHYLCIFAVAISSTIYRDVNNAGCRGNKDNTLRPTDAYIQIVICSDNGLSPDRHQAIIWTIAGTLLIWTFGTNFSKTLSESHIFFIEENVFENIAWLMAAVLSRPQCVIKKSCRIEVSTYDGYRKFEMTLIANCLND